MFLFGCLFKGFNRWVRHSDHRCFFFKATSRASGQCRGFFRTSAGLAVANLLRHVGFFGGVPFRSNVAPVVSKKSPTGPTERTPKP